MSEDRASTEGTSENDESSNDSSDEEDSYTTLLAPERKFLTSEDSSE